MATAVLNSETKAGSTVVQVEGDIKDIDPTSLSRSVCVTGFQKGTKSEDLVIHFQRKRNGGGDIERIIVSKKGTAVITFDNHEVVSSVLQHKQKYEGVVLTVKRYLDTMVKIGPQLEVFELVSTSLCLDFVEHLSREQTKALLEDIKKKTGVNWIESSQNFILSGTFKQLQESRICLQQCVYQSNGILVFNDLKRKEAPFQGRESGSSPPYDEGENQEDVNQNRPTMTAVSQANHPHERNDGDTRADHKAPSASPETQSFEIEPKIVNLFAKARIKDLEDIEIKYHVEIPREAKGRSFSLKPKDACSADDYEEACNQFITLYQKMYQLIKMERFSLKSEKNVVNARKIISQIGKNFPISVEVCKDRKHWEIYGEASHIEEALKYLESEGVEINREKENAVDKKGRRKPPKDDDEAMDIDPSEHSRGDKNPSNKLETFLAGKVKVSVYKGDITKEQVDVIVNAANGKLEHDGGVSKAILDKGGKKIKDESWAIIKKRGVLKDGEAVHTKSGNLPCKAIVHAVGPRWDAVGSTTSKNILRRACLNSFIETEKLNMTSIALPAIGSGIYGMPKDVCAEVMFDALDEFLRQGGAKKKKITDIRFVNIDDSSVQAFTKEFNNRYGEDWEDWSSEKATGVDTRRFSTTGAGGGGSSVPTSRSNRSRGRSKNNPYITNPNGAGVNQYGRSSIGSSAGNNGHPLSPASHPSSSYSSVVKGNTAGHDPSPPIDQQPRGHKGNGGFSPPLKGGDGVMTDKKEEEKCPICLDLISSPRSLKCKHVFCSGCLQSALDVCNKCPVCQEPQGVLKGNQPRGEMRSRTERYGVPGYGGYGTIVIDYFFPSGVQGPEHPNPGQSYQGTSRTAYLPDTREGREVLQLLKKAFDARLVFTVGTSITTGISNQVIWNDIHHKTSVHGGSYGFGYPDPDYLRRVKEELASKGIR